MMLEQIVIIICGILSVGHSATDPTFRQGFLDCHNYMRSQLALGKYPNQPPAADMTVMDYDTLLEERAIDWNNQCIVGHDTDDHRLVQSYINVFSAIGQNWAGATAGSILKYSCEGWWNEYTNYDYASNSEIDASEMIGHYTQMAWAKSTLVGCAVTYNCNGAGQYVQHSVCNYAAAGNYNGESPYKQGPACSQCPDGFTMCMSGSLCARPDQCSRSAAPCSCALTCQNGGVLDKASCTCQCATDYFGDNCQNKCEDTNQYCAPKYIIDCTNSYWKDNCKKRCNNCVSSKPFVTQASEGVRIQLRSDWYNTNVAGTTRTIQTTPKSIITTPISIKTTPKTLITTPISIKTTTKSVQTSQISILATPMTSRQGFLDCHNYMRSQLALGKYPNQPPAADMTVMDYDTLLEERAIDWNNQCIVGHDTSAHRLVQSYTNVFSAIGQNWAGITSGSLLKYSCEGWWNEYTNYNYASNSQIDASKMIGHYTQMAWAKSTLVGCAVTYNCNGAGQYVQHSVCNYAAAGNYNGEKPYKQGPACSQCPDGFTMCMNGALCARPDQCSRSAAPCSCALTCQNGGVLDKASCTCQCATGYFGDNCQNKCEDTNQYCAPGYIIDCTNSYWKDNCKKRCNNCVAAKPFITQSSAGTAIRIKTDWINQ